MSHTNYIKSLIVSLTILILTTLVSVSSQAETATSGNLLPNAGDGVNTNAQNSNSTIDGIDSATGFTLISVKPVAESIPSIVLLEFCALVFTPSPALGNRLPDVAVSA